MVRALPAVALVASLAVSTSAAGAAQKPDFSGSWKMDPRRSRFGRMTTPEAMTLRVEHHDPQLEQTTVMMAAGGAEDVSRMLFHTEGIETSNTFQGMKVRSTARWDGQTLVLESRPPSGGKEVVFRSRWRISADRSVLTMEVKMIGGTEDAGQEIVFTRE